MDLLEVEDQGVVVVEFGVLDPSVVLRFPALPSNQVFELATSDARVENLLNDVGILLGDLGRGMIVDVTGRHNRGRFVKAEEVDMKDIVNLALSQVESVCVRAYCREDGEGTNKPVVKLGSRSGRGDVSTIDHDEGTRLVVVRVVLPAVLVGVERVLVRCLLDHSASVAVYL